MHKPITFTLSADDSVQAGQIVENFLDDNYEKFVSYQNALVIRKLDVEIENIKKNYVDTLAEGLLILKEVNKKVDEFLENKGVKRFQVSHYAEVFSGLMSNDLSVHVNNYDIDSYSSDIPEEIEGKYAVIVDIKFT